MRIDFNIHSQWEKTIEKKKKEKKSLKNCHFFSLRFLVLSERIFFSKAVWKYILDCKFLLLFVCCSNDKKHILDKKRKKKKINRCAREIFLERIKEIFSKEILTFFFWFVCFLSIFRKTGGDSKSEMNMIEWMNEWQISKSNQTKWTTATTTKSIWNSYVFFALLYKKIFTKKIFGTFFPVPYTDFINNCFPESWMFLVWMYNVTNTHTHRDILWMDSK